MNLEEIVELFQTARQRQIDVVRLHTGEPSIYGAIGEQMDALDRLQIAYEVVPGISAFQAAAATLKVELTAPDIAQTIILTRTPGRTPMPPSEDLVAAGPVPSDVVHLPLDGSDRGTDGNAGRALWAGLPAALVFHASWPDEKIIRGTLSDIGERIRGAERYEDGHFSGGICPGQARTGRLQALRQDVRPRLPTRHFTVKIAVISLSREGCEGGGPTGSPRGRRATCSSMPASRTCLGAIQKPSANDSTDSSS